jgi:hypothetical protein
MAPSVHEIIENELMHYDMLGKLDDNHGWKQTAANVMVSIFRVTRVCLVCLVIEVSRESLQDPMLCKDLRVCIIICFSFSPVCFIYTSCMQ